MLPSLFEKNIFDDVKEKLEDINDPSELEKFVKNFKDTGEYKALKTGQGLATKTLNLKNSSIKALESMVEEKKDQLSRESHKLG